MASKKEAMVWAPLEDGSLARQIDGLEAFFVMLNNFNPTNEHWAISVNLRLAFPPSFSVSGADPSAYVKRAWLLLCRQHPTLTGSLVPGDEPSTPASLAVKPLATDADDEAWLDMSFFTWLHDSNSGGEGAVETAHSDTLFATLRNKRVPTCHWLPASSEVHIRCQHWRIDGIGMLMLADRFMEALASVVRLGPSADWEAHGITKHNDAVASLTPCLYDVADTSLDEETTPAEYIQAADGLVGSFLQCFPSISLPTTPGSDDAAPGDTGRIAMALSTERTSAVVAACKARGINVASAVHAAVVRVAAAYPQHPLAKSYASFFPVDLRRHIPPRPSGGNNDSESDFVVNNFCSGIPCTVAGVLDGKSYNDLASEIGAVYASDLCRPVPEGSGKVSILKLVAPYLRRTTKLFSTPPPPGLPPVQTPDLSSLGKVEQYVKRAYTTGSGSGSAGSGPEAEGVEVTDLWLGTQMLTRQLQCHVWTFRDRLTVQGTFNTSFYESGFVVDVLDKIRAELLIGLGVE